jgi:hypothetical protein
MNRLLAVSAFGLLATACLTERAAQRGRDRDGDGHEAWQLDGSDCDDDDPAVNPDQEEVCGNGVDDNCDGLVDDGGMGESTWYLDADADGVAGSSPQVGCVVPIGALPDLAGGVDCDDGDAGVSPNAQEIWYDGVDQNCDGNDADADGDGVPGADGGDCDDNNPHVRPGVLEICNNGIDDNCDGSLNQCGLAVPRETSDAVAIIPAETAVLRVLDLNSDGIDDLVVHEEYRTSAYFGPLSGLVPSGSADLRLTHARTTEGASVDFANLDNQGTLEWVVGDDAADRIAVWWNPTDVVGRREDVGLPTLITAPDTDFSVEFGDSLRVVAGINPVWGDGLVVSSERSRPLQGGGTFAMGIRMYAGPWTGPALQADEPFASVEDATATSFGASRFDGFIKHLTFVGEVDDIEGVHALSVPFNTLDTELTAFPPLMTSASTLGVDTQTAFRLMGSRLPGGNNIPVTVHFVGIDASLNVTTGGGVLPSFLDVANASRQPFGSADLVPSVQSTTGVGQLQIGGRTVQMVDRCDLSPYGDVFVGELFGEANGDDVAPIGRLVSLFNAEGTAYPDDTTVVARGLVPLDIVCGDLDNDGVEDLAVSDVLGRRVYVFRGTTL